MPTKQSSAALLKTVGQWWESIRCLALASPSNDIKDTMAMLFKARRGGWQEAHLVPEADNRHHERLQECIAHRAAQDGVHEGL